VTADLAEVGALAGQVAAGTPPRAFFCPIVSLGYRCAEKFHSVRRGQIVVVICANRALLRAWLQDQLQELETPESLEARIDQALQTVEAIAQEREGANYRLVEKFSTWIGARDGSPRFPVYLAHVQDAEHEAVTCQMIFQAFTSLAEVQEASLADC
jgi:hypothetical protein